MTERPKQPYLVKPILDVFQMLQRHSQQQMSVSVPLKALTLMKPLSMLEKVMTLQYLQEVNSVAKVTSQMKKKRSRVKKAMTMVAKVI